MKKYIKCDSINHNKFPFDNTSISFNKKMNIAAEITKNNESELSAIEGYQKLLAVIGEDDKEAIDIINEIISDEKNHVVKLNELMEKYDNIPPNKD